MDQNYELSRIFLCDENDEGYGFLLSEKDNMVYAQFWAPNADSRKVVYHSSASMYKKAQEYSKSLLLNYSPLHTAQHIMFKAYMTWYESKHLQNGT